MTKSSQHIPNFSHYIFFYTTFFFYHLIRYPVTQFYTNHTYIMVSVLSKNQKIGVALTLSVILPQKKEILGEKLAAEKKRDMPHEYSKGTRSR
jgi:hypothetical protein